MKKQRIPYRNPFALPGKLRKAGRMVSAKYKRLQNQVRKQMMEQEESREKS